MLVVEPVAWVGEGKVALETADSPRDSVQLRRDRDHRIEVPHRHEDHTRRRDLERVRVHPLLALKRGSRAGKRTDQIGAVSRIGVRCIRPLGQRIEEVERVPHDLVCSRRGVPAANAASRLQPFALRSLTCVEERVLEDPAKVEDRAADTVGAGKELFVPVVSLAPDPACGAGERLRRRHAANRAGSRQEGSRRA